MDDDTSRDDGTSEYPIATDRLHKGVRVEAAIIEHAFGVKRGSKEFQLRALQTCRYIARRLDERGEPATVIQEGDEIVVLTDEQARVYNARRFSLSRQAGERAFRRLGQVDRANLSDNGRKELDRDLVVIGRRIQADRAARREVAPKVMERATPGALPEPDDPEKPRT